MPKYICYKVVQESKDGKRLVTVPSENVEEIVRCKDCTKVEEDSIFREYWCDGKKVPSSHYCGYGVRKDV